MRIEAFHLDFLLATVQTPDTRISLIARISDPDDAEAWEQFSAMYRPVVVAMARSRGMQLADAEDLAQAVLLRVSHAVERFEVREGGPRFRSWLRTIASRLIINTVTRTKPGDVGRGGSLGINSDEQWNPMQGEVRDGTVSPVSKIENADLTGDVGAVDNANPADNMIPADDVAMLEYRREVFRTAAAMIRGEFSEATWDAFWATAVEGKTIDEVASKLNRSHGSIYTARSRVLSRLKKQVATMDPQQQIESDQRT